MNNHCPPTKIGTDTLSEIRHFKNLPELLITGIFLFSNICHLFVFLA